MYARWTITYFVFACSFSADNLHSSPNGNGRRVTTLSGGTASPVQCGLPLPQRTIRTESHETAVLEIVRFVRSTNSMIKRRTAGNEYPLPAKRYGTALVQQQISNIYYQVLSDNSFCSKAFSNLQYTVYLNTVQCTLQVKMSLAFALYLVNFRIDVKVKHKYFQKAFSLSFRQHYSTYVYGSWCHIIRYFVVIDTK